MGVYSTSNLRPVVVFAGSLAPHCILPLEYWSSRCQHSSRCPRASIFKVQLWSVQLLDPI